MTERIIQAFAASPIPAGCCTESGRWVLCADADKDITIADGATVELLLVDGSKAVNIDIDVRRGGVLRIVEVVTSHSATQLSVAVGKGAECTITQVILSASDVRVVASLVGREARFELGGVFVLTDGDQTSVTADVNHMTSDCVSRIKVKGVASGKSHGRFSGLVYVAPDAQRTDSEQTNRNVTIGEGRIETLPQLEIYADDVKCSHGATVGQMDSDAILYMRQRGLSLADAKRLQIEGFVDDVVLHSAVEGDVVAEVLTQLLADKLNEL